MKNFVIVGSGRQGVAVAYDLLSSCYDDTHHVIMVDINPSFLEKALKKISKISNNQNLKGITADVTNETEMLSILSDIDVMISAVPYEFNLGLTKIAIKAKISMVDLGGHTKNVIKQLKYSNKAKESNITIVPDCGMGPGMNITMACLAMEKFDIPQDIYIWDVAAGLSIVSEAGGSYVIQPGTSMFKYNVKASNKYLIEKVVC